GRGLAGGGTGRRLLRPAADGPGFPSLSRLHRQRMGAGAACPGPGHRVAILQAAWPAPGLASAVEPRETPMLTMLMITAALQAAPADPRPDLGWMAGYWLMCERGEVSETWSDPRHGLMTGMNVTVRDGRAGFELSRIAPTAA